jgi:hypothetical protein
MLVEGIRGVIERSLTSKSYVEARVVAPSRPGDPYYVFLALRRPESSSYEEYRETRLKFLEGYVKITKLKTPAAEDIVGIAFPYKGSEGTGSSEDLLYFDARHWTKEDEEDARKLQQDTGFLSEVRLETSVTKTFPDEGINPYRGRDRNKLCFCGSGLKLKKCHGR